MQLSKIIRSFQIKDRRGVADGSSELTFIITDKHVDEIIESNGSVAIGRTKNDYFYLCMMRSTDRSDIENGAHVKWSVIDALSKLSFDKSGDLFNTVKSMAANMCEAGSSIPYMIAHDIGGFGPFSVILDNRDGVEEITLNSPTSDIVVYHSKYGFCTTNLRFSGEDKFRFMINKLISETRKELGSGSPIIDAQIWDGSRVHAQISPYSISGGVASIRLRPKDSFGFEKLLESRGISPEEMAYIWMALESRTNIIIAGAPAAGKTTLLRCMIRFTPRYERIITIEEDTSELVGFSNLYNMVQLKGSTDVESVDIARQTVNALHLRPDRLIVGEIRGGEAKEVFFGANLGVPFITTMHSNSAKEVITRLRTKPMSVDDALINMIDVIIFMRRRGVCREIDSIIEYRWLKNDETDVIGDGFETRVIFENHTPNKENIADSKVTRNFGKENGMSKKMAIAEINRRAKFVSNFVEGSGVSETDYIESYNGIINEH